MAVIASAEDQSHKAHRSRKSGPNAKKKSVNDKGKKEEVSENDRKRNPKVINLFLCLLDCTIYALFLLAYLSFGELSVSPLVYRPLLLIRQLKPSVCKLVLLRKSNVGFMFL